MQAELYGVFAVFSYYLLRPRYRCVKYCDQHVSVCLFVCPLAHLKNRMSRCHEIFRYRFPCLPLTVVQYLMYFRFYG